MFGHSAPVHLEINKLLLEIPSVSELGTEDLLGVIFTIVHVFNCGPAGAVALWSPGVGVPFTPDFSRVA